MKPSRQPHTVQASSLSPERYGRWRNETGRLLPPLSFDGVVITDWTPWRVVTLSPSAAKAAKEAGLTRIGYAQ